jgi:hypothetical protein
MFSPPSAGDVTRRRSRSQYADEIADNPDVIGIVIRNLNVGKFILDQDHQFETIEPIEAEIIAEVRFISDSFGINTQILGDEPTYPIRIKMWRSSLR